jgi:hypothetical protein
MTTTVKFIIFGFVRSKIVLSVLLGFFAFFNIHAQNIETRQVEYKEGSSGTTIESSIVGDQIIDFIVNAKEGQVMKVSMSTDNPANYFNIMEPNEDYVAIFNGSINENMYKGELEKSGNYKVRVYLMRSAARRNERANFRLEMNIAEIGEESASDDALVVGTSYNATGNIPCWIVNDEPKADCGFGVSREGNGSAKVIITRPDGSARIIYFIEGKAAGYNNSEADSKPFNTSKTSDLYLISIGDERYEIPEAVIFGG